MHGPSASSPIRREGSPSKKSYVLRRAWLSNQFGNAIEKGTLLSGGLRTNQQLVDGLAKQCKDPVGGSGLFDLVDVPFESHPIVPFTPFKPLHEKMLTSMKASDLEHKHVQAYDRMLIAMFLNALLVHAGQQRTFERHQNFLWHPLRLLERAVSMMTPIPGVELSDSQRIGYAHSMGVLSAVAVAHDMLEDYVPRPEFGLPSVNEMGMARFLAVLKAAEHEGASMEISYPKSFRVASLLDLVTKPKISGEGVSVGVFSDDYLTMDSVPEYGGHDVEAAHKKLFGPLNYNSLLQRYSEHFAGSQSTDIDQEFEALFNYLIEHRMYMLAVKFEDSMDNSGALLSIALAAQFYDSSAKKAWDTVLASQIERKLSSLRSAGYYLPPELTPESMMENVIKWVDQSDPGLLTDSRGAMNLKDKVMHRIEQYAFYVEMYGLVYDYQHYSASVEWTILNSLLRGLATEINLSHGPKVRILRRTRNDLMLNPGSIECGSSFAIDTGVWVDGQGTNIRGFEVDLAPNLTATPEKKAEMLKELKNKIYTAFAAKGLTPRFDESRKSLLPPGVGQSLILGVLPQEGQSFDSSFVSLLAETVSEVTGVQLA